MLESEHTYGQCCAQPQRSKRVRCRKDISVFLKASSHFLPLNCEREKKTHYDSSATSIITPRKTTLSVGVRRPGSPSGPIGVHASQPTQRVQHQALCVLRDLAILCSPTQRVQKLLVEF